MRITFSILLTLLLFGCQTDKTNEAAVEADYGNPAAEGFNMAESDSMAIVIADSVMEAMGGRENWDNTQFITWNFFGRRVHTWDKINGIDRIEFLNNDMVIEFDVNTKEGTVMRDGEEVTDEAVLTEQLQRAYEIWVNDSYWLVMPYKLKDSGLTLNYLGIEEMESGTGAHKLQLTFDGVGVTPQNKYHVYVDTTDYLVKYWKYFPQAEMEEPRISTPWANWESHGNILLSGDRGQYQISDVAVLESWPE